MSVNQVTTRKKPVLQDKTRNAATSRQSRDKLETEKKKVPEDLIKRKALIKQTSVERTRTVRPVVATRPQDATGSKPKVRQSDERRGVSTIYMPKKPTSRVQNEAAKSIKTSEIKAKDGTTRHRLPSRERRKSRTLSPSEVKVLKKATSKRDSSDYEYEDDFEDYESDFQECTDTEPSEVSDESQGSEELMELEPVELKSKKPACKTAANTYEEHMLDSGHYDLDEARRRAARIELMSASRGSRVLVERPMGFAEEKPSEIKSLPSSADEGFEDGRSGDFAKSPPLPGGHEVINMREFSRKFVERPEKLSRGRELLQMIKLDTVGWSIFESTPVAYEEFITIHGKINTRQIATQTNEDNLSVETQTDEVKSRNMWTQFPVVCRGNLKSNEDINQFNKELIGVGCDDDDVPYKRLGYDILQLNEFLGAAGKVVLALLEEKEAVKIPEADESTEMPFSEATINLAVSAVTFLSGRPVLMIRYSDLSSRVLLTIHAPADEEIETANEDFFIVDCCVGCQWNIYEPSRPTKLFYSASSITACCVHPVNYNIVFGGLEDGSISLWDLEEDEAYHPKFVDKANETEWLLRSPTFSTIGYFEDKRLAKIVALRVISKIETDSDENFGRFMPIQICSLDEEGTCTTWSVLRNLESATSTISQQLGQSWWGKIRLVKSHQTSLTLDKNKDNVMDENHCMSAFRDLNVDTIDTNNLYIATNTSKVLHAMRTGKRLSPSAYDGNFMDYTGTTCIETSPFGQPYFLVGCTDGTLRLYSSVIEKPLLQLKNLNSTAPIKTIQWSRSKPFTIYVLDEQSNIHIWDLSKSDIFPLYSISTKKHATVGSIQLSPCRTESDMKNQYLALGLDNGTVEIHKFNRDFYYSNSADRAVELNTFLYYVAVY